MLKGYKSPWSSKTILSAAAMILTLLGTLGVHALSDDAGLKKWTDIVAAIVGILTQTGVITFRASATEKIGEDPGKYVPNYLLLFAVPLLGLSLAAGQPGCAKVNDALGIGALNNAPPTVQRYGEALVLYTKTTNALSDLQDAGLISAEEHDRIEPYNASAYAALVAMKAAIVTKDDVEFSSALSKFNIKITELVRSQFVAEARPKKSVRVPMRPTTIPQSLPEP